MQPHNIPTAIQVTWRCPMQGRWIVVGRIPTRLADKRFSSKTQALKALEFYAQEATR